ncbi:GntR family transcriptional regulator [Chelatococcus reniformis]|uniref:GntR family transcriptional regulator n=1 Tax=Chelatococcus reniformis TaxID=1494448 RepID=A0A916UVI7_9HYPH|nr:GntR family transcriptional regulator [Chelatococcus reniformis]GGC89982.1 GntR family transcriptional regulator [Chelatococcus reniformis]
MLAGLTVSRENLTSRVHSQLREALMAGRFWPGQRLRIHEIALAMGVSQTPVREAIMQLAREGGLEMRSSQAITVTRLSVSRYKELREVRLLLEGLATEKATPLLTANDLAQLAELHGQLVAAERSGDHEAATLTNFHFHFLVYRASHMSDLVSILEGIWLRNGPLLKFLYPHAAPAYPGTHQHVTLMAALKRRDAAAARHAIQDDIVEGGARLVELMEKIEAGSAVVVDAPDGGLQLDFPAPRRRRRGPAPPT